MSVEAVLKLLLKHDISIDWRYMRLLLEPEQFLERKRKDMAVAIEENKVNIESQKNEGYPEEVIYYNLLLEHTPIGSGLHVQKNSAGEYRFVIKNDKFCGRENFWEDIKLEELPVERLIAVTRDALNKEQEYYRRIPLTGEYRAINNVILNVLIAELSSDIKRLGSFKKTK